MIKVIIDNIPDDKVADSLRSIAGWMATWKQIGELEISIKTVVVKKK